MKTRLKVAGTLAILFVSLGVFSGFLRWMNQPSDLWLYAGALGVLLLAILVPALIAGIWRPGLVPRKRP